MIMYNFYSLSYSYGNIFFCALPWATRTWKDSAGCMVGQTKGSKGFFLILWVSFKPCALSIGQHNQIEHNVCKFLLDCFPNVWNLCFLMHLKSKLFLLHILALIGWRRCRNSRPRRRTSRQQATFAGKVYSIKQLLTYMDLRSSKFVLGSTKTGASLKIIDRNQTKDRRT